MKWARVVGIFAEENKITTSAALDFFYHSDLYPIISKGISDLHCESDLYLAQLLSEEWEEKSLPEKPLLG